jgi:hypothetical protein
MRWFRTVIVLPVPVLVVGCLPTTPAEAGVGVVMLGLSCVLAGLGFSLTLFTVPKERKTAAMFVVGVCFLIGGGLIAVGVRLAGWAEAGVGAVMLGLSFVLTGLGYSLKWLKVEEGKTAARLILGACFLIGGVLIAVGGRLAGWWGQ